MALRWPHRTAAPPRPCPPLTRRPRARSRKRLCWQQARQWPAAALVRGRPLPCLRAATRTQAAAPPAKSCTAAPAAAAPAAARPTTAAVAAATERPLAPPPPSRRGGSGGGAPSKPRALTLLPPKARYRRPPQPPPRTRNKANPPATTCRERGKEQREREKNLIAELQAKEDELQASIASLRERARQLQHLGLFDIRAAVPTFLRDYVEAQRAFELAAEALTAALAAPEADAATLAACNVQVLARPLPPHVLRPALRCNGEPRAHVVQALAADFARGDAKRRPPLRRRAFRRWPACARRSSRAHSPAASSTAPGSSRSALNARCSTRLSGRCPWPPGCAPSSLATPTCSCQRRPRASRSCWARGRRTSGT